MLKLKKILVITIVFIVVNFLKTSEAQTKNNALLFIKGMPVKIDGGCSFYVDKKVPLTDGKFQLIIDANHRAFIEFKNEKYVFFDLIKRKRTGAYYTEYYQTTEKNNAYYGGKKGSLILKIDSIGKFEENQTLRSGIIFLKYPGLSQTLKMWGKVDLRDSYYYKIYH